MRASMAGPPPDSICFEAKQMLSTSPCRGRYSPEGAMEAFICTACGTQYPPSDAPPQHCPICEEERQYIPPRGQTWTTLEALAAGHFNSYRQHEAGVIGLGTQPAFAIGQRALLGCTPNGNVRWD